MANLDDVVSITAKPAGSLTAPSCGRSVNVQHVDSLDEPEVFVKDAVTHLGVRDNKVKKERLPAASDNCCWYDREVGRRIGCACS